MSMVQITPKKMSEMLVKLYLSGVKIPTIMLHGAPGVGKSEGVKGFCQELSLATQKKVNFSDIRLLNFSPVDVRGIPVPHVKETIMHRDNVSHISDNSLAVEIEEFDPESEEFQKNLVKVKEKFSIWLKPIIFNLDPSPDVINVLLLDEITAAPPSVQASAYQLTLDRKIGEHTIPDNTIIIGAGNRITDKGVVYKMPTPLANRMSHFEVVATFEDWKPWAIKNGIHQLVVAFLSFRENYLHKFDPNSDDLAFPTPRSWEFVSRYLKVFETPDNLFPEEAKPIISATIGEGVATELRSFAKTFNRIPNTHDIYDGKPVKFDSNSVDVLCALCADIVVKGAKKEAEHFKNLFNFLMSGQISAEYATLIIKDLILTDAKVKFMNLPEWMKWVKENKALVL
jgi:MoxR-like ATPases